MNLLTLIVIGIIVLYTFLGYKAGLIKTIFSICSMIVALVLTIVISPHISTALKEKENVVSYFSEKVDSALNLDKIDTTIGDKAEQIKSLPIPESLKKQLLGNDNSNAYSALNVTEFTDYISHSIACIIINALSFVITFIVLLIALRIICMLLDIISKLPVIHQINKLTGLIAGFIRGMITIWLLCIVLTMFSGSNFGKDCFEMINESVFLSIIYNNNFILNFIVDFSKSLF